MGFSTDRVLGAGHCQLDLHDGIPADPEDTPVAVSNLALVVLHERDRGACDCGVLTAGHV